MTPDPDMLTLGNGDWAAISATWRDVLSPQATLLGVSLFGDLFVSDASGAVFMLQVTSGELAQIAYCREEFEWELTQAEKRVGWLMESLAHAARAAGLLPQPGECLAFRTPPILNGQLHPSNLVRWDLVKYHQGLAKLFAQLRGLPAGTQIVAKPSAAGPLHSPPMQWAEPAGMMTAGREPAWCRPGR